ncbi:MAG: site-specific integrase [Paludibacteraceae bacterium]|nr:site-specific integrase [Paludibacteraceae bacterium]
MAKDYNTMVSAFIGTLKTKNTINSYRNQLTKFETFIKGIGKTYDQITAEDAEKYKKSDFVKKAYKHGKCVGNSTPSSMKCHLNAISSFYKFLNIEPNPFVGLRESIKETKVEKFKVPTTDEVKKIISDTDMSNELRVALIYSTIYGVKIGNIKDFNTKDCVKVNNFKVTDFMKNKDFENVDISNINVSALKMRLSYYMKRKVSEGLLNEEYSFKDFRHYYVCELCREGKSSEDICKILNFSTVFNTNRYIEKLKPFI